MYVVSINLSNYLHIFIGTFYSAPKPFCQLYLINAYFHDQMLPCVFALLQRRDRKTYIELFEQQQEQSKSLMPGTTCELNPVEIGCDFESAVHQAYRIVWPNITIKGCYFHFRQANCRWLFLHGYKLSNHTDKEFKLWCRRIGALALIPLARVRDGWELIKASLPTNIDVSPIINYFESTWLNGIFKPSSGIIMTQPDLVQTTTSRTTTALSTSNS